MAELRLLIDILFNGYFFVKIVKLNNTEID